MAQAAALLLSRGIFDHHDKSTNNSCPWHPPLDEPAAKPLFGNRSFHDFNEYLSGACAAFSTLSILVLFIMHATHFSRPREQRKILKIMLIIPYYSLFNWLSVLQPRAGVYLAPWLDVLQSVPLATFFLLILEYISDAESDRQLFFAGLKIPTRKALGGGGMKTFETSDDRLCWYRNNWAAIFQYVPVSILVAVAMNVTDALGVYCPFGNTSFHFAKVYLVIIINISVTIAVAAILGLYNAIKTPLASHKPLAKLICFKIVVLLGFLISIIFLILNAANVLKPTSTLSYGDIKSLQPMILCVTMVPISIYFHIAYSWQEYRLGKTDAEGNMVTGSYQGGFLGWKAILYAFSWMEVLRGLLFTFRMFAEAAASKDAGDPWDEDMHASSALLGRKSPQYARPIAPVSGPNSYNQSTHQYPSYSALHSSD